MALSPLNTKKATYPARSISLPARSHPISSQFDEYLSRLKSSKSASTSSSSSSIISHNLNSLKDLYDCTDKLLQLPLKQQITSQNRQAKWVDEVLDGSLRLLDICGLAKDVLSQTKSSVQDIQSMLRRRGSGDLIMTSEVMEYISMRKRAKKTIKKCLKDIKGLSNKCSSGNIILSELEEMTAEIFEILLSHIAGSNTDSRKTTWSVIFKPMHRRSTNKKEERQMTNEFEDVDEALHLLVSQKKDDVINSQHVEKLQSRIVKLESVIQDFDEVLESLFRCQVKTRVALLNVLSN